MWLGLNKNKTICLNGQKMAHLISKFSLILTYFSNKEASGQSFIQAFFYLHFHPSHCTLCHTHQILLTKAKILPKSEENQ